MKHIIENIKKNLKLVTGALVIGVIFGWLFFYWGESDSSSRAEMELNEHDHEAEVPSTWTCSMHPQIKQDKPGDCPICGMDLIPLVTMDTQGDVSDPNEIIMTDAATKLAAIQTIIVGKGVPERSIYLQGKIQEDEREIAKLTARFGGRIEQLYVNYTGQNVVKGQKLATIYSPDLVSAQKELLEASKIKASRPGLYSAAKSKLRLWDLSDKQIESIETGGEPQLYFEILSPISGTVTMRHISIGEYVKEGMPLFKVVDLTKVWVMFDAYESDLPWINIGDNVEFTVTSVIGQTFKGKVTFIDPFIDAVTRVAKVRVEVKNTERKLKPEMFVTGIVLSKIAEETNEILIPKSAILWTGKRSIVYVKVENCKNPSFIYREIVLGPGAGNKYIVTDGLEEGEEIAVNGVFKIDAAAQLQGLPSMMNPEGGVVSNGHNHGESTTIQETDNQHVKIEVGGNCDMCKDRIESAALSVPGVTSANWDSESLELHISYNGSETDQLTIEKAIAGVGHDTENYKSPDDVYNELPGCCLYERFEYDDSSKSNLSHTMFNVLGNCDMCKERIEEAAKTVIGVESAIWDSKTKMLHIKYDSAKISTESIQMAIAAVGHDTKDFKAPDSVYKALPECCLYDRNNSNNN